MFQLASSSHNLASLAHISNHLFQLLIEEPNANSIPQEREAEFRDQSESTNSKIVRYTIIQLIVLGVTCAWQLSHLRSFFIKQKLT
jgi:hypothetical protein